ncbi:helical backbone metal receptor [soil metagenome]
MFEIVDQLQNKVVLNSYPPKRIVSLVPSQTELLHDLELEEEVIGITKFCVHPQSWHKSKTIIGGTKNINIEKIKALQPDLILANKEENIKEQIEALENIAPVWISDVTNFEEAISMIESVGLLTGKSNKTTALIENIKQSFRQLQTTNYKPQTVYLIWNDPYMTVGGDTFINDMLEKCGLQNMFKDHTRYPQIAAEKLVALRPSLVLLSSEPYPFKEKHIQEIKTLVPNAKILLVDGEMFSWYGSRMLYAAQYFKELINYISDVSANNELLC